MSFVKQSKAVTLILGVITLILVIYNLGMTFLNSQLNIISIGTIDIGYFLKFDTPDYFILIWELFWFVVGGFVFYIVAKKAKTQITSEQTLKKFEKYEFAWLGIAIVFYIIFSMVTIPLANSIVHSGMNMEMTDTQVINVTGQQFSFSFSFENGTRITKNTELDSSKAVIFKLNRCFSWI